MEDFRIDIVLGEGVNARTINLQLKPFTLIGATTRTGLLSAPLRDRFQMREHLDFYSIEELSEIVARNMRKLKVESDDASAGEIALRSRGTPRLANNRLRWVRDYALSPPMGGFRWRSPATAWICWESTGWASIRKIASIWKRSPGYSAADRWGLKRWRTR